MTLFAAVARAEFFGDVKTGLINVASDQYGYSLYVPTDYTPDRRWPLVLALHDEGQPSDEYIQRWLEAAKERGFVVFCPNYPVPRDVPYESEAWILKHKRAVESQYEIDPNRILVTGSGFGGHYALYLGLRYPREFSAIASIGEAVIGKYTKLFSFSFAEVNRLPVLILKEPEAGQTAAEGEERKAELDAMISRGYAVELVAATSDAELKAAAASPYIFEWFDQVSLNRERESGNRSFNVKQNFFQWIDNLLQNR